jgi:hypothetical protein
MIPEASYCLPRLATMPRKNPPVLRPPHLARICLKLPNQLLQPRVADAKFPRPSAAGRSAWVPAGEPQEHVSADD